jgi:hypothetical protein
MENLKGTDQCPCGSGLTYLECCADQIGGKWHKNDDGEIVKQIKLPPDLADALKKSLHDREQKLGRKLRGDDPLFDITPEQFTNTFLESYFLASEKNKFNFNPTVLYVFIKDGMLLFESNIPKLSTGDRIQILEVIKEYALSDDRPSLLIPFKDTLTPDNYKKLSEMFEQDDEDGKEIYHDYMDLLINDTVIAAIDKQHAERIGRNDPCLCGSGKKFKKCCGKK